MAYRFFTIKKSGDLKKIVIAWNKHLRIISILLALPFLVRSQKNLDTKYIIIGKLLDSVTRKPIVYTTVTVILMADVEKDV